MNSPVGIPRFVKSLMSASTVRRRREEMSNLRFAERVAAGLRFETEIRAGQPVLVLP
jgi:molybdopterin biosynthesis enzyme